MSDILGIEHSGVVLATIKTELEAASPSRRQRTLEAIVLDALGSIPCGIFARLDNLGTEIEDRIESDQYLAIARKAFRECDQADTQQKRDLIVHPITRAAGTRVGSDSILRPFLDWIEPFTQHAVEPVTNRIVRTDGAYLIDEHDHSVLDAISAWWVIKHRHRHPVISFVAAEESSFSGSKGGASAEPQRVACSFGFAISRSPSLCYPTEGLEVVKDQIDFVPNNLL